MTQRIAIRTDASLRIGTGHVMRCLTLAGALREKGAEVRFISRALDGHLIDRIEREGFAADILPAPDGTPLPEGGPAHAAWAEVPVARDAAETAALLDRWPPDWLILDHYAFDREWESVAKPATTKLMVIDDLADRPHIADLLLDQNLGRQASDYAGLVPETCTLLIGPRYALLRPEFAEMRDAALKARAARDPRHILVAMGGVDLPNMTSRVLDALSAATLPKGTTVTVVMGRNAPALAAVQSRVEALPYPARLRIDAPDMAQLMAEADLAIGGVGVTTWERCALGLPTLMIPIAENQWPLAKHMASINAAKLCEKLHEIASDVENLLRRSEAAKLSETCSSICDGTGSIRVSRIVMSGDFH